MSELALKLIADNKSSKANHLDLGNCGLAELPVELAQCMWLETLALADYWYLWDGNSWHIKSSRNRGTSNRLANVDVLKSLPGLRELRLPAVSSIESLPALQNLQKLFIADATQCDLGPVARLPVLQALEVLSASDLPSLQGLPLTYLVLTGGIEDLTFLRNLLSLNTLYLSYTQVEDLTPLKDLIALTILHLSSTKVQDLTPLRQLSQLKGLFLSRTRVNTIEPIASLGKLTTLHIAGTKVSDLRPVVRLRQLSEVDLSGTPVEDIRPLARLRGLDTIRLSGTKVSDISPLLGAIQRGRGVYWHSSFQAMRGIHVDNCPLVDPPLEIVQQGNEAILSYFEERREAVDHLYEAKMLLIGEGRAGKTSLLRRLYKPGAALPGENETTKGIDIGRHEFPLANGRTFRLNVWDFGGQEIYHPTHHFFLTRRSLYVLVDDSAKDYKSATDEGFKYWLELVEVFGDKSPVLIFLNEKGGRSKAIDLAGIKARFENVQEICAGNLENTSAADILKRAIEYHVQKLPQIGDELPAAWVEVREEIETRAAQVPHISQQEYFEIYARHLKKSDETKALHLSRYLHDLGVFLHFQDEPLLADTVILQNDWATTAVFRVLDEETVKNAGRGRFTMEDCRQLWPEAAYRHKHAQLVALMEKFELCYRMPDSKPTTWLATQLLPPSKPEPLRDWGQAGDLVLRYRYDFLPKGMISRLMVRLHRYVRDAEKAWRTGVLFERDGTSVLVELLGSGNEIELRGRGTEKKELLSVVAADLDALNDSFQGLREKVDKLVPCNCSQCSKNEIPEFFAQKKLLKRKLAGKLRIPCEESYQDVDVLELLDGIRVDKLPVWAKEEREPARAAAGLRKLKMFIASSSELREDRDEFDRYFREKNDELIDEGVYLEIVKWENFLDAMSATGLQDEYDKAVEASDFFVSLFFTKTGEFTEREFDVAHRRFQRDGRPLIWTYFKNADVKMGSVRREDLMSLRDFQEKLRGLKHYWTEYRDIEHLKRKFRDQLVKVLRGGGMA